MSKKTLLVLAASQYQLDTIRTAQRLGCRVVVTDNIPTNPGHALADKTYNIDTTDRKAILGIARQENIDGVIAACTDVAVPTAAYIAEQLNLSGPLLKSAEIVCNKVTFRTWLRTHRFPTPEAHLICADSKIDKNMFEHDAWIMKPDRSSGGKGVFIVRSETDYFERLPETLSFSPAAMGIMEKFLDGFQGTCEGVLKNGDLALAYVLDRQTAAPPYVTTCGQHMPSRLSARSQTTLFSMLKDIWSSLEITDGPFDCDFVASGREIYILEVSPRIGGNSISALLKKATDFDLVEYSIRQACGDQVEVPCPKEIKPTAVVLLGVQEKGRLYYDENEAESLTTESWVYSLSIDVKPGVPVLPFINGRHRVGEAIVCGRDRDDLDAKVIELKRRLRLKPALTIINGYVPRNCSGNVHTENSHSENS